MEQSQGMIDSDQRSGQNTFKQLFGVHAKVVETYHARCSAALQHYVNAAETSRELLRQPTARSSTPTQLWSDANAYWLDFAQRSVLFWDTWTAPRFDRTGGIAR